MDVHSSSKFSHRSQFPNNSRASNQVEDWMEDSGFYSSNEEEAVVPLMIGRNGASFNVPLAGSVSESQSLGGEEVAGSGWRSYAQPTPLSSPHSWRPIGGVHVENGSYRNSEAYRSSVRRAAVLENLKLRIMTQQSIQALQSGTSWQTSGGASRAQSPLQSPGMPTRNMSTSPVTRKHVAIADLVSASKSTDRRSRSQARVLLNGAEADGGGCKSAEDYRRSLEQKQKSLHVAGSDSEAENPSGTSHARISALRSSMAERSVDPPARRVPSPSPSRSVWKEPKPLELRYELCDPSALENSLGLDGTKTAPKILGSSALLGRVSRRSEHAPSGMSRLVSSATGTGEAQSTHYGASSVILTVETAHEHERRSTPTEDQLNGRTRRRSPSVHAHVRVRSSSPSLRSGRSNGLLLMETSKDAWGESQRGLSPSLRARRAKIAKMTEIEPLHIRFIQEPEKSHTKRRLSAATAQVHQCKVIGARFGPPEISSLEEFFAYGPSVIGLNRPTVTAFTCMKPISTVVQPLPFLCALPSTEVAIGPPEELTARKKASQTSHSASFRSREKRRFQTNRFLSTAVEQDPVQNIEGQRFLPPRLAQSAKLKIAENPPLESCLRVHIVDEIENNAKGKARIYKLARSAMLKCAWAKQPYVLGCCPVDPEPVTPQTTLTLWPDVSEPMEFSCMQETHTLGYFIIAGKEWAGDPTAHAYQRRSLPSVPKVEKTRKTMTSSEFSVELLTPPKKGGSAVQLETSFFALESTAVPCVEPQVINPSETSYLPPTCRLFQHWSKQNSPKLRLENTSSSNLISELIQNDLPGKINKKQALDLEMHEQSSVLLGEEIFCVHNHASFSSEKEKAILKRRGFDSASIPQHRNLPALRCWAQRTNRKYSLAELLLESKVVQPEQGREQSIILEAKLPTGPQADSFQYHPEQEKNIISFKLRGVGGVHWQDIANAQAIPQPQLSNQQHHLAQPDDTEVSSIKQHTTFDFDIPDQANGHQDKNEKPWSTPQKCSSLFSFHDYVESTHTTEGIKIANVQSAKSISFFQINVSFKDKLSVTVRKEIEKNFLKKRPKNKWATFLSPQARSELQTPSTSKSATPFANSSEDTTVSLADEKCSMVKDIQNPHLVAQLQLCSAAKGLELDTEVDPSPATKNTSPESVKSAASDFENLAIGAQGEFSVTVVSEVEKRQIKKRASQHLQSPTQSKHSHIQRSFSPGKKKSFKFLEVVEAEAPTPVSCHRIFGCGNESNTTALSSEVEPLLEIKYSDVVLSVKTEAGKEKNFAQHNNRKKVFKFVFKNTSRLVSSVFYVLQDLETSTSRQGAIPAKKGNHELANPPNIVEQPLSELNFQYQNISEKIVYPPKKTSQLHTNSIKSDFTQPGTSYVMLASEKAADSQRNTFSDFEFDYVEYAVCCTNSGINIDKFEKPESNEFLEEVCTIEHQHQAPDFSILEHLEPDYIEDAEDVRNYIEDAEDVRKVQKSVEATEVDQIEDSLSIISCEATVGSDEYVKNEQTQTQTTNVIAGQVFENSQHQNVFDFSTADYIEIAENCVSPFPKTNSPLAVKNEMKETAYIFNRNEKCGALTSLGVEPLRNISPHYDLQAQHSCEAVTSIKKGIQQPRQSPKYNNRASPGHYETQIKILENLTKQVVHSNCFSESKSTYFQEKSLRNLQLRFDDVLFDHEEDAQPPEFKHQYPVEMRNQNSLNFKPEMKVSRESKDENRELCTLSCGIIESFDMIKWDYVEMAISY